MKWTLLLVFLCNLFLIGPLTVVAQAEEPQNPEAVDLNDPKWSKVFDRIEKSYNKTMAEEAERKRVAEQQRRTQESNRRLQEIEQTNREFQENSKPFNSQLAPQDDPWGNLQQEPDPYAAIKKQLDMQQQQDAQRRAEQDAAQQRYMDNLFGRGGKGNEPYQDSGAGRIAPSGQSNSGQKPAGFSMENMEKFYGKNRGPAESSDSLDAGPVYDTPPPPPQAEQAKQPTIYCSCRGGDWNEYDVMCVPHNGENYPIGYYPLTSECHVRSYK